MFPTLVNNKKPIRPSFTIHLSMSNVKTARVPHLFGTEVGYQMPEIYDSSKPTCILINSFTMTSDLYAAQYKNQELLDAMNLLAVEP